MPLTALHRTRLYWACQIIGWSLVLLANILVSVMYGEHFTLWCTSTMILCTFAGLPLTHLYRAYILRFGLLNLPLKHLLPRVITATVFMCILLYGITIGTGLMMNQTVMRSGFGHGLQELIVFSVNVSVRFLLWSAFYFGFHYVERFKQVEIDKWRLEAALKDSELQSLKSQINPHFLFNSLNTVRALASENPEKSQFAVTYLSNILRYALQITRFETVPLATELTIVQDYIALETLRFEQRLKTSVHIEAKALQAQIPPMILQTLVENAIKHGIAKRKKGGEVSIEARVEYRHGREILLVNVSNTGNFDASASMADMYRHTAESCGIGLENTRERLELLYGNSASLSIMQHYEQSRVETLVLIPFTKVITQTAVFEEDNSEGYSNFSSSTLTETLCSEICNNTPPLSREEHLSETLVKVTPNKFRPTLTV